MSAIKRVVILIQFYGDLHCNISGVRMCFQRKDLAHDYWIKSSRIKAFTKVELSRVHKNTTKTNYNQLMSITTISLATDAIAQVVSKTPKKTLTE